MAELQLRRQCRHRNSSGHFLTKPPAARLTGAEQDFRNWLLSRLFAPA
ncbi:hypothetical protein [Mesorhizobium sp.]